MAYNPANTFIFPHPSSATEEGIVAVGGVMNSDILKQAYQKGIFPWYDDYSPIMWWCPDPRFVLFPGDLKVSKSLRLLLKKQILEIRFNSNFEHVLSHCRNVTRPDQGGTWITKDLFRALMDLNKQHIAVSAEAYLDGQLVGGLFGELYGNVFFGESMFSLVNNASKAAFVTLVQNLQRIGVAVIDCQIHTPHLESLGATMIPRERFLELLDMHFEFYSRVNELSSGWQPWQPA
jgi:leucyl/phenylalanyl-tRNA---protein transferase